MGKTLAAIAFVIVYTATSAYGAQNYSIKDYEEPSAASILLDVAAIRPLGIASMVLGAGVFIISLPFSLPTGSVDTAAKKLIKEPFVFTFKRPVGEIDGFIE